MIKFAIQLFINLILILPISGQVTWFPHGAKWHYEYFSFWEGTGVTTLEVLNEDTLIGNNIYKRILSTTLYAPHEPNDSLYTHYEMLYVFENNQAVYGYNKWTGDELLYDFNAEVGDTLDLNLGAPSPFIVDSVGIMNINGFQLKFQIIRFPSLFLPGTFDKMQFLEGVGSLYSHLFHSYTQLWIADVPVYNFRCYEDENIGLLNLYPNIDCDYIPGVTSTGPVTENYVSVFPNPANNFLIVKDNSQACEHLLIVDLLGKVRINEKITSPDNKQLDIHELENGIYFVIGEDRKGQILFREKFCKFSD